MFFPNNAGQLRRGADADAQKQDRAEQTPAKLQEQESIDAKERHEWLGPRESPENTAAGG